MPTKKDLEAKNAELRLRLEEAEETVRAIRDGAVDAFVVAESDGNRIYTLEGADRPYRLLVERMHQGAATLYADGTIAYCNLRFATLVRLPHQQLTGALLAGFFPEEEQRLYERLFREGKAGISEGELHLEPSQGPPVPVLVTLNALPDDSGAAIGVLVTDLTAQKHQEELATAHEALRESQGRLSEFLEQLPIGVGAVDTSGRWTISNAVMRSFAPVAAPSKDPERFRRWRVLDTDGNPIPPSEWPTARALRGDTAQALEMVYIGDDGKETWTRMNSMPLHGASGEVTGAIVILQDIDAVKRAEIAVRDSEARFRSLVSVITDVPWTTDAEGAFVTAQPSWAAYTGQTREEYQGLGWTNAFHPDDRENIRTIWQRARESRDICASRIRLWNELAQEYRYCEKRGTPLLNPDGSIREWVGTCTDVHERVEAEAELREADRRKDNFLAMLAHELRNPLAPIRSAAHVMRMLGPSDPQLTWTSDVIERQVRHLSRLVDDLLDVSRITQGKVELKKEVVELSTAVASAVEANRALIDSKRQELTADVVPLVVSADVTRLTQIISNLLNNAAKYTQDGGRIAIIVRQAGDVATIKIKDSGPGIPRDLLTDVFDLFTQGERSMERAQGGLGIGLTIVKSLVELHGGRIDVESEEGNGAEFTVTLPALKKREQAAARGTKEHGPSLNKAHKKVLVVDDHLDGAEALTLLLKVLGHDVRSSLDGPTALEVAREFDPDVVLLDIGLPGMDGYEVARRMRKIFGEKNTLLVAMTGYGQEEDKRQAHEAGFDLHLTKPVSGEAVATLLDRS
jgi:PAS domain S-box-containing protein